MSDQHKEPFSAGCGEKEKKKVKMAITKKTLAGMTRLNFSSVEAESQNTGMFLKHRRTNKRKPNLPVAV